jgi:hypothetical protein
METLIVKAKDKKELKFISELLKRLNIEYKVFTEKENKEFSKNIEIIKVK